MAVNGDNITVTVLNLAGEQVVSWTTFLGNSVGGLKHHIAQTGGPPPICQVLTLEDRALTNEETFQSLECHGGHITLNLLVTKESCVRKLYEVFHPAGALNRDATIVETISKDLFSLCELTSEVVLSQGPLLEVAAPARIFGNISGNFPQLCDIFAKCGDVSMTRYVGLGSYGNRGLQGLETLCLLFVYKCLFPDNLILLRGKHECGSVSRIYGLYDECKRRAASDGMKWWRSFVQVFNHMPFACVVSDRILCVASGLSVELPSLKALNDIHRPTDVPDQGFLCDLLWAEPDPKLRGWMDDPRDGNCFGYDVAKKFLDDNGYDMMCRSSVVDEGYEYSGDGKLVTLISVADYAGEFNNKGAVMIVDESCQVSFSITERLKPDT